MTIFDRTKLLVGDEGLQRLQTASVAVFGLGGVGGYAFEALVRSGIGKIVIVDSDLIEPSNVNRQILALAETMHERKVEVARKRATSINPDVKVTSIFDRITPENAAQFVAYDFGHAIDAIDTLKAKIALILELKKTGKNFVTCLGAARRLDPTTVRVADISETSSCPLAKCVRLELRRRGITKGVRCVFSNEPPFKMNPETMSPTKAGVKSPQGSLSVVPGLIGLTAAGLIINDILYGK